MSYNIPRKPAECKSKCSFFCEKTGAGDRLKGDGPPVQNDAEKKDPVPNESCPEEPKDVMPAGLASSPGG
jgi:hypothetical protein